MRERIERLTTHPRRFRWTRSLLNLLGTVADKQLAQIAGIHPETVTQERQRRGIGASAPRREPIAWTPAMIRLLGTAPDRTVATILSLNHRSVYRKRKLLEIAPFQAPPHERTGNAWSPRALRLLGKMSDRALAQRLGIPAPTVQFKRSVLGIPPFKDPLPAIQWTGQMLELLGKITDRDFVKCFSMDLRSVRLKREELGLPPHRAPSRKIVRNTALASLLARPNPEVRRLAHLSKTTVDKLRRELGVPAPDTRRQRWTPKRIALLAQQPDAKIAAKLKLSVSGVSHMRRTLGIAAYSAPKKRWTPGEIALLGTAPDSHVAGQVGRSVDSVKQKRQRLNTPQPKSSAGK